MNSRTLYLLSLIGLLLGGLTASLAAPHNTLLDVRVGPHKSFDRVVFEFQAEVAGLCGSQRRSKTGNSLFRRQCFQRLLPSAAAPGTVRG